MFNTIRNVIHPRRTDRAAERRAAIERARYTVSWFMTGVRPDASRVPRVVTGPRD